MYDDNDGVYDDPLHSGGGDIFEEDERLLSTPSWSTMGSNTGTRGKGTPTDSVDSAQL